jgi:predicted NBD/HSP70 family sugar kinase
VSRQQRSLDRATRVVRFTPGITRQELAHALGITVSTVNPVVAELLHEGAVEECEASRPAGTRGRPRAGLRTAGTADVLGVVLWSHGMLDISLSRFDRSVLWRRRTPVADRPTLGTLGEATDDLLRAARTSVRSPAPYALVLGLPAPYETGVGVAGEREPGGGPGEEELGLGSGRDLFANWFDDDPARMLAERVGIPVRVENDANLGALGEARHGIARTERCSVQVKISGSGIGAGITVNGRVFDGAGGVAGEIAHVRVNDASTVLCSCGSRGCLKERVGAGMLAPLRAVHGPDLDWSDLLALVDRGDPGALRVVADAGRTTGRALADLCTFLNPSMIVVDAGSPDTSRAFLRGVEEQVERSTPPFIRRGLRLETSSLGEDAPLLGAIEVARVLSIGRAEDGDTLAKRAVARRTGTVWL